MLGKHKGAIEDLDKAIELNPNNEAGYINRGNSKNNFGQYQEAIEDYDKAIQLNPNNQDAYFYRKNAYENLNKKNRRRKKNQKSKSVTKLLTA